MRKTATGRSRTCGTVDGGTRNAQLSADSPQCRANTMAIEPLALDVLPYAAWWLPAPCDHPLITDGILLSMERR